MAETKKKTVKASAKDTKKKTTVASTETKKRKPAVKKAVTVEFAGKSFTTEALVQSAKDVWKYDLLRNEEDFKRVELYVKPEESKVYYVINGDVTGDFLL